MKKKTLQFRHGFYARSDAKIQAVLADLGCVGIGAYWCIIEMLYENNGILPMSQCNCIALALHLHADVIQRLITAFGLFENDGENFWSPSVNARLGEQKTFVDNRRKNALKRWNTEDKDKNESDALAMQVDATAMQVDAIASSCIAINNKNKSKNNNIIISPKGDSGKRKAFAPPTLEEVKGFLAEKGITNVDAERFIDYYESIGWMVGRNKMRDWKEAVCYWSRNAQDNGWNTTYRQDKKVDVKDVNSEWEM